MSVGISGLIISSLVMRPRAPLCWDSGFLDVETLGNDTIRHYAWWGYQLTKTVQNGCPQAISEILHIEYQIVCCIETYLIHIYHMSKCSKCNWNCYIEGFCMWNVHFHINGLSPNISFVILMSWHLMAIYFLSMNYWLFSYIIFNGNK